MKGDETITSDLYSDSYVNANALGYEPKVVAVGGAIVQGSGTLSLTGKTIEVNIQDLKNITESQYQLEVFSAKKGTVFNLGSTATEKVDINLSGEISSYPYSVLIGISAMGHGGQNEAEGGGVLNVNSKTLNINIAPSRDVAAYAILAQGNTTGPLDKGPKLTLNADTRINVTGTNGVGIVAYSRGTVDVLGNLYISAKEGASISARGQGTVNINKKSNKTVQITGDIDFNYDGFSSKTLNDGQVTINLSNSNSFWNGSSYHSAVYDHTKENISDIQKFKIQCSSLSLNLSNNAVWNPTLIALGEEISEEDGGQARYYAPLNSLKLDNGIVNVQNNGQPVIVQKLEGNGTINIETTKTESGISAGQFVVGNAKDPFSIDKVEGVAVEDAAKGSKLTVNFKGVTSDDITSEEFKALAQQVQALGAEQEQITAEGVINGAYRQAVDPDGNVTSSQMSENTVTQSLRDIGAVTFLGFRTAINDLDKRLGDLRSYSGENGGWVRYLGGQNRYGDRNMKLNYNGFQAGFDHRFGEFYAGAAFGYTKGSGHLHNGSSDHDNWNFGLYGGWLGEKGQFVDIIVKRHRFKNEFSLHNTSGLLSGGSYHNWATSVSAEAGWRLSCPTTGFYAEPQAELSFGRMEKGSFTTSQGVKVQQNAINSTVGRLGVAAGYTLPDSKGNAYVKASVLHDWSAKVKVSMSKGNLKQSYRDDLGGTWAEFSVGGTYNATKNISAYGEFQTSAGSPVRSPWAASVGVRYNF